MSKTHVRKQCFFSKVNIRKILNKNCKKKPFDLLRGSAASKIKSGHPSVHNNKVLINRWCRRVLFKWRQRERERLITLRRQILFACTLTLSPPAQKCVTDETVIFTSACPSPSSISRLLYSWLTPEINISSIPLFFSHVVFNGFK